ncbi:restriction endonuclease subunit S [Acinetobacter towneri]|uniref:restriction endonuclease subunit S n=1 Tax=Acinetobacter towneri TaxID=202956 RepID=UPI002935EF69|nr:restriction endonuclease subunit S [Acinetobacter towneri]MDV2484957.1 restriction endonuclease subunit S [Acinetobacter towneri]
MAAPKLRFKEFDGDWSETLFQDLFIFKNGVNASKEQYGSGIKFINVLDIINNPNGITYDSIIGSVNITSKEIDKNLVKYGDVLFQRSSETREEVGQSNVYLGKDPVVFGGFVIRGSAQKEYDPIFMNGLLKTDSLRDQITQLSGGSTRFNIGQDSLNKVSAYLPLKEEQTKIASFLSAVDEKISQLTKKHELLNQYKQGMMQKLFSQQIRFKADDGSEFGEWKKVKFSDKFKFHQTNSYSRALLSEQGEIMNIHYGDIHTKFSTLFDISKEVVPFLSSEVNTNKFAEDQFLQVGDLVIADASEDYKDIGKALEMDP